MTDCENQKNSSRKGLLIKTASKVLLVFLLCAVVPVLFLGFYAAGHATREMSERYESLARQDLVRYRSILFDLTTSVSVSVDSHINDRDCMELFATNDPDSANMRSDLAELTDSLSAMTEKNGLISSAHIFTDSSVFQDSSYITVCKKGYPDEEWSSIAAAGTWRTWKVLSNNSKINRDPLQLAFIRRLPVASQERSAYLVVRIDSNTLRNRLGEDTRIFTAATEDGTIFISSDIGNVGTKILYPQDLGTSETPVVEISSGEQTNSGTSERTGRSLNACCTLTPYMTDTLFYLVLSDTDAYVDISSIRLQYSMIILILTGVSFVVILIFSRQLAWRIGALKTAMHRARLGEYDIADTMKGNDDLTETFEDLKYTVADIRGKEEKYYKGLLAREELKNRQQQMEFKLLASQINPHFLYNTLETIRMKAVIDGNREVADEIKLLAKLLRYVLSNTGTEFTTLDKELDYMHTYFDIMRIRFGDRMNFTIDTEEGLDPSKYRILPLLLQPIAENAVIHGMEDISKNGMVHVDVRRYTTDTDTENTEPGDGRLCIAVIDNGSGMNAEELAELRRKLTEPDHSSRSSIGLYNINQRIHLCYGETASLSIDSATGRGTTVALILPLETVKGDIWKAN